MGTHYSHVTPADRMSIQALLQAKLNSTAIARKLGISRSTISREINRGKAKPTALAGDYQAGVAQARSQQRRRDAGAVRRKLGSDTQSPLWRTVIDGLRCRWSPQQIAGKLPEMNKSASLAAQALPPGALSVSHETIYCAIYAMPRSTLRTELVGLLRKSHKTRLPRTRGTARKGGLPNMTNISLRPPEVAARIVPGHRRASRLLSPESRSFLLSMLSAGSHVHDRIALRHAGQARRQHRRGRARRLQAAPQKRA